MSKINEALDNAENDVHRIEGEWGMCRSVAKMRADGDEDILLIDAARAEDTARTAALTAIAALAARHRYGAERWADPLPVPEWVIELEALLTGVPDV